MTVGQAGMHLRKGGLEFLLCGMEPSRHPPLYRDGHMIGHMPFPEIHIYRYTVLNPSGKVSIIGCGRLGIIGSGKSIAHKLNEKVWGPIDFGRGTPKLNWARAHIAGQVVAHLFDEVGIRDVGGPFQVVRLTPEGLFNEFLLPPTSGGQSVMIPDRDGKTILSDSKSGEKYILHPVWDM